MIVFDKVEKKLYTILFCVMIVFLGYAQKIDIDELSKGIPVTFKEYSGEYAGKIDTAEQIRGIGRNLGTQIKLGAFSADYEWLDKYSVERVIQVNAVQFGADKFFLKKICGS